MRRNALLISALVLLFPAIPPGGGATGFEGGPNEIVLTLTAPSYEAAVNITVPVKYHVIDASFNVAGLGLDAGTPVFPENVSVILNDTVIWEFNGTGYGPLGLQDRFSNGSREARLMYGTGGGMDKAAVLLPKGALVRSASVDLKAVLPKHWDELMNYTGAAAGDYLAACSGAGDVNGDGYDDIIVGACGNDSGGLNTGQAYLLFGGLEMNNTPDLTFTGSGSGDSFGVMVSGAGDVNGDGFDDVMIGAPCNDASGNETGRAYIFFGGKSMDNGADVILTGEMAGDEFGFWVADAGDVNGDGYDDVIVGARLNDANGTNAGRAYLYFGGRNMDTVPDVIFAGNATEYLGYIVSGAGDLNKDGYADVIVGAPGRQNGTRDVYYEHLGRAYVYFGGRNMDNNADLILAGADLLDEFGLSVTGAGDLNGDGYDDVAVGAPSFWNQTEAGRVEIFFGGQDMDNRTDITLKGAATGDVFGWSVSGAGDLNNDGVDDLLVGAPDNSSAGPDFGRAYIFYGGQGMDGAWDMAFNGTAPYEKIGDLVVGAGDVNNDSIDEVLVGATNNYANGNNSGRVYLYSKVDDPLPGLLDASLAAGATNVWEMTGHFKGTAKVGDFSSAINDFLRSAPASGTDRFGNSYVDVPFSATANNEGNLSLYNLKIEYNYDAAVPDFAGALDAYIDAHKGEADAGGNLSVPIKVRSESAGRVRLSGLAIGLDLPPVLVRPIGAVEMDEDTVNPELVDLFTIFEDETDPDDTLNFSLVSATNSSFAAVSISNNRYISVDASTGNANDNWTGEVEAVVSCTDRRGQLAESDIFFIRIKNVNDPPLITSSPILDAEPGAHYTYDVVAVDGDGDQLRYKLAEAPPGMTIDQSRGNISWIPGSAGNFTVRLVAEDGTAATEQAFTLTVPERPPVVIAPPSHNATTGNGTLCISVGASDPNGEQLTYEWQENGVTLSREPTFWHKFPPGRHSLVLLIGDGHKTTSVTYDFTVVPPPDLSTSVSGPVPVPVLVGAATVSIVAVGLAFVVGTETGKYRVLVFFLPLYTRLRREEVLDNETRGMIRGYVCAVPGTHYNDILRRLKLSNGSAAYHLKTLEREGYIRSKSDGRLKRFYPVGMKPVEPPIQLDRVKRLIIGAVQAGNGVGHREITRTLKLPYSTVNRQINKLARLGILRLEKHGFTVKCYLSDEYRARGLERSG